METKMSENLKLVQEKQFDLSQLTVGLGWAMAQTRGEIPAVHYPGTVRQHQEHDLDMVAILLNQAGKIAQLGGFGMGSTPNHGDVIFHKVPRHASAAVWLSGDNRTGSASNSCTVAGHADGEQIVVDFAALGPEYHRIVFLVMIHEGKHRSQNFGVIQDAYVRALDARHQLITRLDISGNAELAPYSALTFAEAVRSDAPGQSGWQFNRLCIPHASDRFVDLLKPWL
jgi:stress response protein SCP2